jgi:hypothetical protein
MAKDPPKKKRVQWWQRLAEGNGGFIDLRPPSAKKSPKKKKSKKKTSKSRQSKTSKRPR